MASKQQHYGRAQAIEMIKRRLQGHGLPRLQMSLMLLLTGACGFLCSYALLHLGLTRMWLRYPIAVICAYGVFLLLLRLWLAYQCRRSRAPAPDFDLPSLLPTDFGGGSISGSGGGSFGFGRGSDFGGGGAGGSWAQNVSAATISDQSGGSSGGGLFDCDLDLDDGWVIVAIVLLVVAALALVVISGYVVYTAPALLAEVFVDGALVTGLYRRLPEGGTPRHWLRTVVRRTWWLVLLMFLVLGAAGYALQRVAPEARSIGGVWSQLKGQ